MSLNDLKPRDGTPQPTRSTELIRTHAEMLAAEANARADRRRIALEELRSDLRSPEERVHAWERVHGLTLPVDPHHPVLDLIVARTGLTMQEVQAVQKSDAALRTASTAAQKR